MNCLELRRCFAVVVICAGMALAQPSKPQDDLVTTTHRIVVGGKPLAYTAVAGRLPIINNDAGEPHGYMFFIAYTIERAPGAPPRPLTFLWNGGPGMPASQVQWMAFGPRRLKMTDTYRASGPVTIDTPLEDNQETWLDFSDLVFIDPIGTGYSRPTKPDYSAEFFNTIGDAESVAEFIRVYRQRFDAFNSPIFLAGESYGVTRAHWVAEALERRRTHVSGIALISGSISLGQKPNRTLATAAMVTRFTAAAYYHKKLPGDLQSGTLDEAIRKASAWAHETYAPALDKLDSLTFEQRNDIISQLARYTGVNPTVVDPKTLVISGSEFTDRLLHDQGLDLGRYDARMTGHRDISKVPWSTFNDPSLSPGIDVMQGTSPTLLRYIRSDLGYKSDLLYRGPFGGAYPAPTTPAGDWMAVNFKMNAPAGVPAFDGPPAGLPSLESSVSVPLVPPLRKAMMLNPALRVVVMIGMYDSIGCESTDYSVSLIDEPFRDRVKAGCYVGGHMMYTDKLARQQVKRDMAELEGASAK